MVNNQGSTGVRGNSQAKKHARWLEIQAGGLGLLVAGALLASLINVLEPPAPISPNRVTSGLVIYPTKVEVQSRKDAITEYLATKYKRTPEAVRKYVELAWREAARHTHVTPELILAIMQKESSLRPMARNDYGAEGLMGVVRRWHPDKVSPDESLFNEEVNTRVGSQILQEYIVKEGRIAAALRKYSGKARGYEAFVLEEMKTLEKI
jgi:soluble lytic murein transglycosylase-like protein